MMAELLDRLDSVVDELAAAEMNPLSDDELLDVLRRLETAKRRLAPVDHRVLNSAAERAAGDAAVQVAARAGVGAAAHRPRRSQGPGHRGGVVRVRSVWSGGRVGPRFPDTAAALADGVISAAHAAGRRPGGRLAARRAGGRVRRLRREDPARALPWTSRPATSPNVGKALVGLLDQDGLLRDEAERARRRELQVKPPPGRVRPRVAAS